MGHGLDEQCRPIKLVSYKVLQYVQSMSCTLWCFRLQSGDRLVDGQPILCWKQYPNAARGFLELSVDICGSDDGFDHAAVKEDLERVISQEITPIEDLQRVSLQLISNASYQTWVEYKRKLDKAVRC